MSYDDIALWPPPKAGDSITVLTAGSLQGKFATATVDGYANVTPVYSHQPGADHRRIALIGSCFIMSASKAAA